MIKDLFMNFSILTTLTVVGCIAANVTPELPRTWGHRLQQWMTLWVGTYILMQFPVVFAKGVIMAFYAVPAALAGMFGGLPYSLVTAVPVALYRLYLGGPGASPGVVHVLTVALIAGLFSLGDGTLRASAFQVGWRSLIIFAVGNLSMLLVPGMGITVFQTYYPIMMPLSASALFLSVSLVKMRVKADMDLASANTMARVDALTGLPNQRSLMEALESRPLTQEDCFLLVDIDHFKQVNDTYGHLCGDEILRCIATVLRREVRPTDLVCRYGGEEFAILMRSCTIASAYVAAERLRQAVAAQVVTMGQHQIQVTISGGLVRLSPEQPFTNQFQMADSLLYDAKTQGRNRVVSQSAPI